MNKLIGTDEYCVYWKDNDGKEQYVMSTGRDVTAVVNEVIEYVRNNLYMDNFKIVEVEQWIDRKWVNLNIKEIKCKGR